MAKCMSVMICLFLLLHCVNAGGRVATDVCKPAKTYRACSSRKTQSQIYICKWRPNGCREVHVSKGDVDVDDYRVMEIVNDIKELVNEW